MTTFRTHWNRWASSGGLPKDTATAQYTDEEAYTLLLGSQRDDGGWANNKDQRDSYGSTNDDGLSPLGALALMAHGGFNDRHSKWVELAVRFLANATGPNGLPVMSPTQAKDDPGHPFRALETLQDNILYWWFAAMEEAAKIEAFKSSAELAIYNALDGLEWLAEQHNGAMPCQLHFDGQPAKGRVYEPAAFGSIETAQAAEILKRHGRVSSIRCEVETRLAQASHALTGDLLEWPRCFMKDQHGAAYAVFGLKDGGYTTNPRHPGIMKNYRWVTNEPGRILERMEA